MQIPLLSGIKATERADFAAVYPVNLEPNPLTTNISKGYLRAAIGAVQVATGPGVDRGGINWNGTLYRVMGTKLVSVSPTNAITVIGDVEGATPVAMDYGFGRLRVASNGKLWDYDGTTLSQVTDPDLGTVNDMIWESGYYITTDGTNIVVTDLADPFAVNPLKYGSAEEDPDMIVGLFRVRGQLYALGSSTIQLYTNTGGVSNGVAGFPFTAAIGATLPVGCVGPRAKCAFVQTFAFVGGGRNEGNGVWIAGSGSATKISTKEIDDFIDAEPDKHGIEVEARSQGDENRLYVHLSDKTLVYLANASQRVGENIWYVAMSGLGIDKPYRLRHAVYAYDQWYVGDLETGALGVLSDAIEPVEASPIAFMSTSFDGETYSQERACSVGRRGDRTRRVQWRPHRMFRNTMGIRFRGVNAPSHFGEPTGWRTEVGLIYNGALGGIVHDVELVGLPGRTGAAWAACEARIDGLAA